MEETDFYKLLEVERTADGETIKKSFRRLAMQYHPDRNPGNKEAEKRFKEINCAYEVLKDEQKRAAYDRYGAEAFKNGGNGFGGGNPFGGFDFNFGTGGFSDMFSEIFSEFMGGGAYNRPSYRQNGEDVRYDMEVSLEEAFKGIEKEIKIAVTEECQTCHGHGTKDGQEAPVCPHCGGAGKIRTRQGGFFIMESVCPYCKGTGKLAQDKCKVCGGKGFAEVKKSIKVKIPAGIEHGSRICLNGAGRAGLRGGQNGDLYIFVSVKKHLLYVRDGANLYSVVPVSFACAALGGEIKIPSIDGRELTLNIPAGTQNDEQLRVKNEGMPILKSANKGDLLIRIKVETPVNLSTRQKELLKEFRDISKDNCSPQSKNFFDKIKDLFE